MQAKWSQLTHQLMAGCYADASSHQPLRMFWLPVFKWSLYRCMFKIPSVESDREPGVRSSSQESYCSYLASHHWGWEIRTTIPFRNTACPVVSWNSNFLPFVTSSLHQSCASHLVVIQFFLMKENKIKRLCLLYSLLLKTLYCESKAMGCLVFVAIFCKSNFESMMLPVVSFSSS